MNSVPLGSFGIGANERAPYSRAMPVPGDLENRVLRQAVQENLVSFPSQVPVFGKQSRPDLQQRIVLLYLVGGWTMDDIARRYGLGRQRVGQILTAWRIRAVKDGYIQAIDPAHPLFERVRLEQTSQLAAIPEGASLVVTRALQTGPGIPASKADEEPPAIPNNGTELKAPALVEQLDAIVAILNNQLRLCSKPLNGNIGSCEPLLARARSLCFRLEAQVAAARSNDDLCARAVISAAKELFQRFQNHVETIPPRTNQRIAISV